MVREIVRQYLVRDLGNPREDGADVEHARNRPQQLHRAFDACGALALDRRAARRFGEALVCQADREVARQPLREGKVAWRVRIGTFREQRKHADDLVVDEDRRAYARPQAPAGSGDRVQQPGHDRILEGAVLVAAQKLGIAVPRAGVQAVLRSALDRERKVRFVVRHDLRGDRAEVWEDVANIERPRQCGQ